MKLYTFAVLALLLVVTVAPPAAAFHHLCPGGDVGDVCAEGHDLYDAVLDLVGDAVGPILAGIIQACRNAIGATCPL